MDKIQQALLDSMNIINSQPLKEFCLEGVITTVNTNDYTVTINEEFYNIKSLLGTTFLVNDIVYIILINFDKSKKYILCKRP